MASILTAYKLPILGWGAVLAIQTRQLFDEGFNEATWLAGCIWITVASLVLFIPLELLAWTGDTYYIFFTIVFIFPFALTQFNTSVPRIVAIAKVRNNLLTPLYCRFNTSLQV